MEVIAYTAENGDTHIVVPNYSQGHTIESVIKTDAVPNSGHKIVDSTKMPSRLLRNAWELAGSKVGVDIAKGKTVAHEHRRVKREEALKDNTAILTKNGAGIPLAANENATTAASENAAYMLIDDAAQVSIDASTSEADLLSALNDIGLS